MKEENNAQEITIKIQTLDNTYSIKINQLLTISQLKEEISKKYNIPKEKQRLIFQGKFLKDNENLSFYKITEGCVVQLIAKSLEENNSSNNNNNNINHQNRHRNHNQRSNEVYPIIQIPFRTNRRRRRLSMPHFDISEYLEGFYQNLTALDNYTNIKKKFDPKFISNTIEAFDFSKSSYEIGEWVDVKDTINQWLEAQVMKVQGNKAYVHYNGWGERWDEWIEFNSPRMRNFKTYTLQSPLTFCTMPYPAIPCDSNIEPQQRPIDIFFYLEKAKKHMENVLDDMNKLLNLRKKNTPLFIDNKFSIDNFEILFKATQMIPFLDRVGRMLSDISLVFSHFVVNPNYYSSFIFGYKRQDLFNEVGNIKLNKDKKENKDNKKDNNMDKENDKNEIKTKNEDSQTPPIESKFMKKLKEEQQLQNQKEDKDNNKEEIKVIEPKKEENKIIMINLDKNEEKPKDKDDDKDKEKKIKEKIIDNKKEEIEDKKDVNPPKEQNEIKEDKEQSNKDEEKDKEKNKEKDKRKEKDQEKEREKDKDNNNKKNNIEEPKEEKNTIKNQNEIIRNNINEEPPQPHQRHNSVPSVSDSREGSNTANFQRQRQRQREEEEEEILANQIVTNLGYDLSFSSIELPFIQRIVHSYTISDRIISPFSPFYQVFSNKKLFPRVNLQVPNILSSGEVMMMTGYSPFSEPSFDVYIRTIAVEPNENNNNNRNNNSNNNNSNTSNNNSTNNNSSTNNNINNANLINNNNINNNSNNNNNTTINNSTNTNNNTNSNTNINNNNT